MLIKTKVFYCLYCILTFKEYFTILTRFSALSKQAAIKCVNILSWIFFIGIVLIMQICRIVYNWNSNEFPIFFYTFSWFYQLGCNTSSDQENQFHLLRDCNQL